MTERGPQLNITRVKDGLTRLMAMLEDYGQSTATELTLVLEEPFRDYVASGLRQQVVYTLKIPTEHRLEITVVARTENREVEDSE